jgi:hypothetical protein
MLFVNDSPNHLVVLDAISRGMKSVSKVNQGHKPGQDPRGDGGKRPRLAALRRDCIKEGLFRRQEGEKQ